MMSFVRYLSDNFSFVRYEPKTAITHDIIENIQPSSGYLRTVGKTECI